ncbi:hypothetical protein LshimejAT787_0901470 [Lyophyllum shimeji]|uniref:Uncharacterized protein n=1 Tax=Lyophyllum shimeji TaxID=47721 RepID=A0A9P3UQ53_LYOSH|nr:hypothetical protein LshimejAT787_0901470 [Lyophyllum shimeji]
MLHHAWMITAGVPSLVLQAERSKLAEVKAEVEGVASPTIHREKIISTGQSSPSSCNLVQRHPYTSGPDELRGIDNPWNGRGDSLYSLLRRLKNQTYPAALPRHADWRCVLKCTTIKISLSPATSTTSPLRDGLKEARGALSS